MTLGVVAQPSTEHYHADWLWPGRPDNEVILMARADLLETMVRAGARGDQPLFRRAVEAVIAEERAKQHHVLADRLSEELQAPSPALRVVPSPSDAEGAKYVLERAPDLALADLVLPPVVDQACRELVEEQHRVSVLRANGLEPRHRVLLTGAPGNGKTSLAEAIASELAVPLLTVRYDQLIGSYLGETTQRLGRMFDHVRSRPCVLFFDEFDAVGKERGDAHETGEIKRVVSTLLLEVDALPTYVVIVAASNHADLLDRAVWRRFQVRAELPPPTNQAVIAWFAREFVTFPDIVGVTPDEIARQLKGCSYAELEEFTADIRRRMALAGPAGVPKTIILERLEQWRERLRVAGGTRRRR